MQYFKLVLVLPALFRVVTHAEAEAPEPQNCRLSLLQTHRRFFCQVRAVDRSTAFAAIRLVARLLGAEVCQTVTEISQAMLPKQSLLGQIDAIGAEAFHILLVEDDELTLKVTEGLLRHCNYQGTSSTLRKH